jgi:hypothetical protein
MEGGEVQRNVAPELARDQDVSASISSSLSFSPGMSSVVISVQTLDSWIRYLSVSSTGSREPAQRFS